MKPLRPSASTLSARRLRGLSLIELMVVVAVAVVIIGLAAPSFSDYIVTQRVRSVHAQLVTDLQFARSEAAARGRYVAVQFDHRPGDSESDGSCYIVITRNKPGGGNPLYCDCFGSEGARCTHPETTELRRVLIPNRLQVSVRVDAPVLSAFTPPPSPGAIPGVNFDPATGRYEQGVTDDPAWLDNGFPVYTRALTDREGESRALRVSVFGTGRVAPCTPAGSPLGGEVCP